MSIINLAIDVANVNEYNWLNNIISWVTSKWYIKLKCIKDEGYRNKTKLYWMWLILKGKSEDKGVE